MRTLGILGWGAGRRGSCLLAQVGKKLGSQRVGEGSCYLPRHSLGGEKQRLQVLRAFSRTHMENEERTQPQLGGKTFKDLSSSQEHRSTLEDYQGWPEVEMPKAGAGLRGA